MQRAGAPSAAALYARALRARSGNNDDDNNHVADDATDAQLTAAYNARLADDARAGALARARGGTDGALTYVPRDLQLLALEWLPLGEQLLNVASVNRLFRARVVQRKRALDFATIAQAQRKCMPDAFVTSVVARCVAQEQYVRVISLDRCRAITDAAVSSIAAHCPHLQALNLYDCSKITDAAVASIAAHCAQLQFLDLYDCPKITDAAVTSIAAHCPQLQSLALMRSGEITDAAVSSIAAHCSQLESLNLGCCRKITEASVALLVPNYPRLRHVAFHGTIAFGMGWASESRR